VTNSARETISEETRL